MAEVTERDQLVQSADTDGVQQPRGSRKLLKASSSALLHTLYGMPIRLRDMKPSPAIVLESSRMAPKRGTARIYVRQEEAGSLVEAPASS